MTRTTPQRPVDIVSLFPELAPMARTAVRLHPRPGTPTVSDSSVGGPLLWPANEPWPMCTQDRIRYWGHAAALDDIRLLRATLATAWSRPQLPGVNQLTAQEQAIVRRVRAGHPWSAGPNALLPVAQLYLRDIPGLRAPRGADLLQVLWCPIAHSDSLPAARLVWRSSASVGALLTDPPRPGDVDDGGHHVPEACVVYPEQVTEYPSPDSLSTELCERIWEWGEREADPEVGGSYYGAELSSAPGWKIGGWERWTFCDPSPTLCGECGTQMYPLLTVDSKEWAVNGLSWMPFEDRSEHANPRADLRFARPVGVQIGRSYNMQIYSCPASFDHPHLQYMQ